MEYLDHYLPKYAVYATEHHSQLSVQFNEVIWQYCCLCTLSHTTFKNSKQYAIYITVILHITFLLCTVEILWPQAFQCTGIDFDNGTVLQNSQLCAYFWTRFDWDTTYPVVCKKQYRICSIHKMENSHMWPILPPRFFSTHLIVKTSTRV